MRWPALAAVAGVEAAAAGGALPTLAVAGGTSPGTAGVAGAGVAAVAGAGTALPSGGFDP